jgi:hypothetical protein
MRERQTPDATRRDGVAAHPVRLADGNVWGMALPTMRLSPRFAVATDEFGRATVRVATHAEFGHPAAIEKLRTAVHIASESGSVAEQYEAFFSLAAKLLRRVHEIDAEAAWELLTVSDSEIPTLVNSVLTVADGQEHSSSLVPRGDASP